MKRIKLMNYKLKIVYTRIYNFDKVTFVSRYGYRQFRKQV